MISPAEQEQAAFGTVVPDGAEQLDLPVDQPVRPGRPHGRTTARHPLPASVAVPGRAGPPLVVAAFAAWLHRHTGQTDLLFGVRANAGDDVRPVRVTIEARQTVAALIDRCGDLAAPASAVAGDLGAVLAVVAAGTSTTSHDAAAPALLVTVELPGAACATGAIVVDGAADRFRPGTADRLAERLVRVLEQMTTAADTLVDDLDIVVGSERALITANERGPVRDIARGTVPERFREQAARFADRAAVTDDRGHRLTYRELDRRSDVLAHRLITLGVRPENRCAVILDRSPGAVVAMLGIMKAGGAYVPIDPAMPDARMAALLDDADIRVVVTDEDRAGRIPHDDRAIVLPASLEETAEMPAPEVTLTAGHLAYVIYTSGSTGRPKGVLVEHGSITHFTEMVRDFFVMTEEDRIAQCAPLWFDVAVFEIFGALLIGAGVHIASDDTKLTPSALQDFFRDQRVTVLMTTPTLLETLDPARLPDLRVMSVGGEAFTAELTNRWAPGRRFINGYGPAEATVEVVAKVCTGHQDSAPPIGLPLANHTAYALDGRMRRVPVGVTGELYLGGPGVARGYLGRPGLTAGVFVPDPFGNEPGGRLYRTGDLVRLLPTGDLIYAGRVDRQVKVRGMRVELGEIEHRLQQHPAVTRAAVLADRDDAGDTRVVGYVVADGEVTGEEIRAFGAAWLPAYMVPSAVIVVPEIPATASGKIDVVRLAAITTTPAEPVVEPAGDLTPVQREVGDVVREILGVEAIALDEDLFAAGGNSLQVLRILSRIRSTFGVVLGPQDFFEDPTINGICALLDGQPAHV